MIRARIVLVSATVLTLGSLTAATSATASVQPTASRHAANTAQSAALSRPDYKHACAAARAGHAACLSLIRVNVAHHLQPADHPDAAPTGDGYGPSSLQSAYALPSSTAGSGQTVAVVDAYNDPDAAADLATYRAAWGLPACGTGCFSVVNENGQASPLPSAASGTGWDVEESLDVDMVSAICPLCHIILVEANSASFSDLGTAENSAVSLGAKFISNSYGGSDSSSDTTYDADYYNHPGVAITASAGDDGYGVEYPAASQDVTAVGGTSLSTASNARGWTESVWGSSGGGEGTGSGCSGYEPKPSWQTDTGCSHRTNNDVSADANPNTGVAVYDSYTEGGWLEVGGTSASSPMIASTFALAGTPTAGSYPSSYIYGNTSALYDVTSGANGSCSPAYLCTAGAGYDAPTGWGTPDGVTAFTSPTPQLGYIQTGSTGSDGVEVHVDTYSGSYTRALDSNSDFAPANAADGTFQLFGGVNGQPQLGFVKTASTSSGTVEVFVDNYSNGSYTRVLNATSDFAPGNAADGTFQLFGSANGEPELGFIKTAATPSGDVEVHIDAYSSSGSYKRVLDATSDFANGNAADGTFELFGSANGEPELGFIKTADTGSGTVEAFVDTYSNGSYHRVLNATSDFAPSNAADGTFELFGSANGEPELGFIKTAATSSGTIEAFVDTYQGSYKRVINSTSDFTPANAANGTFELITAS
jgi:subtilase family serine protease